jgi:replicative DNA helicase
MKETNELRIPPQNIEAEQSVLGGVLLDNKVLDGVTETLKPEHFYKSAHQKIYSAMLEMSHKGDPIDLITLNNYLKEKGQLENVGDTDYIAFLSSTIPTAANVEYYANIVRDKAMFRKFISAGTEIAQMAYKEDDLAELTDHAQKITLSIAQQDAKSKIKPVSAIIGKTFKNIEEVYEKKVTTIGIPTGFMDLDDMTSGLKRANLIVLAGRPSMGKTACALNIARNVSIDTATPKTTAIFTLEMSEEEIMVCLLSTHSEVNSQSIESGRLTESEWSRLTETAGDLSEAPIYIDDTQAITALQIRTRCRRLKAEKGLDLVIVDYMQLMSGKGENREQEISGISRALKGLAKELDVPVIAISQLNRQLEQRPNKRPRMSDLRESGAIEQDADLIIFVYRDEVYNEKTADRGVAELIIAKQRKGPVGKVKLLFKKEYTKFHDLYEGRDPVYKDYNDTD